MCRDFLCRSLDSYQYEIDEINCPFQMTINLPCSWIFVDGWLKTCGRVILNFYIKYLKYFMLINLKLESPGHLVLRNLFHLGLISIMMRYSFDQAASNSIQE